MKKTFIILFCSLVLYSCEQAPLIEDYKIEEIGLGDSLLKRFSKDYILNNSSDYYDTELLTFDPPMAEYKSISEYDTLQASYNKNDPEFTVLQIAGVIFYNQNINNCLEKKDQIEKELSTLLKIEFFDDSYSDEDGKYHSIIKIFENEDMISLYCSDWFEKTENDKGWTDNLRLEIVSNEYNELLGFRD